MATDHYNTQGDRKMIILLHYKLYQHYAMYWSCNVNTAVAETKFDYGE